MHLLPRLSKRMIPWTLLLLCFLVFGFIGNSASAASEQSRPGPDENYREHYEKAVVLEVKNIEQKETGKIQGFGTEQQVKVRALSGKYKGQEMFATNNLSGSPGIDINVKPGDQILLVMNLETKKDGTKSIQSVYVADRVRSPALGWLGLLFAGLILIIGRLQGLKALLGLGVTALGIYKILLPGLIAGKSALPLTIMVLIGVTLFTMIFVAGFSRKSLAATLGTLGGLLIAGLLAYYFGDLAALSGLGTEEERMLLCIDNITIDMRGLLFSGILIGALGAIMDVAMSVASTISEVKKVNPGINALKLIGAGMNVGRDIMGTMLILLSWLIPAVPCH